MKPKPGDIIEATDWTGNKLTNLRVIEVEGKIVWCKWHGDEVGIWLDQITAIKHQEEN